MTVRFANHRIGLYITLFILSATVLGLSAHFANLFLPNIHHDFTIFSLIVPSVTIFLFLILLQWAAPWSEAVAYFVTGVLWLTMAAWATDIIGTVQCDSLVGQKIATKSGDMRAQEYCYEMKVIQAFSWAAFVFLVIAFIILVSLCGQAQRFGRPNIWSEPIQELGWFGEWPGYYNTHNPGHGMMQVQQPQPSPGYYPQYPQYARSGSQGGHAITIQHGTNGAPPVVTTTPL
jgi:hypothetical protein